MFLISNPCWVEALFGVNSSIRIGMNEYVPVRQAKGSLNTDGEHNKATRRLVFPKFEDDGIFAGNKKGVGASTLEVLCDSYCYGGGRGQSTREPCRRVPVCEGAVDAY